MGLFFSYCPRCTQLMCCFWLAKQNANSCLASIYIHFFQLILWPLFYHGHFVSVFNGKTNTGTLRLFTLSYILCRLLTSFAINPWILLLLVLKDSSVQFLLLITIFNCIVDTSIQQKIKLYWTFFTHVITQRSHTQQMMINKWYTYFFYIFLKGIVNKSNIYFRQVWWAHTYI